MSIWNKKNKTFKIINSRTNKINEKVILLPATAKAKTQVKSVLTVQSINSNKMIKFLILLEKWSNLTRKIKQRDHDQQKIKCQKKLKVW